MPTLREGQFKAILSSAGDARSTSGVFFRKEKLRRKVDRDTRRELPVAWLSSKRRIEKNPTFFAAGFGYTTLLPSARKGKRLPNSQGEERIREI
jgi:hypothetical protein